MKQINDAVIIGIDHGYGNIKTANHCFKTAIDGYDSEPLFTKDMLVYDGRYYLIGEGYKEFIAEKARDDDFWLLTLAAIAMELRDHGVTVAAALCGTSARSRVTESSSWMTSAPPPRATSIWPSCSFEPKVMNQYRLNVRFDLRDPRERAAAEYIRNLDFTAYKSRNRFIVSAVCVPIWMHRLRRSRGFWRGYARC